MKKVNLERMTWKEAEEAFRSKPVVLIPMGSVEEHGPQAPVGDYRYTEKMATAMAEATNAVVVPTIPWGYSDTFRNYPGTLTVRPQTLTMLLEDITDCLVRFGIEHIMMVCGHKGNLPILEQFGRAFRQKHGLRIATIEPLGWIGPEICQEVYGTRTPAIGHGSDPMQSLAMYLFPEDVRLDLMEEGTSASWQGLSFKGTAANVDGYVMHMYMTIEEVTEAVGGNGVLGDPKLSSAERGEKLFQRLVEIGIKMINTFKQIDPRC